MEKEKSNILKPKFRIGDKVRIATSLTYTIEDVVLEEGKYTYKLQGERDLYSEIILERANNLKKFDPVMVSDTGNEWSLELYHGAEEKAFNYLTTDKSITIDSVASVYTYIVPLADFDFFDLESNIERSVV